MSHSHNHTAGSFSVYSTKKGIKALKSSFLVLTLTALLQAGVVWYSGSVGLLADTIHNVGDALTAVPLGIAFILSRRPPTRYFTYGYGRLEDFAGLMIVLIILGSAAIAGYESFMRFFHLQSFTNLIAVAAASILGFAGNEVAAMIRIKTGKEIKSAALIADGYHARADGIVSLSVLIGVAGTWLGYPVADPVVGILISIMILKIVWDSGKTVFTRMLDGVEPEVLDEIIHSVKHVPEVAGINEVRARWLGHRLHAEVNITVKSDITVSEAHRIAMDVQRELSRDLNYLSNVVIHVDPFGISGENYHIIHEKE